MKMRIIFFLLGFSLFFLPASRIPAQESFVWDGPPASEAPDTPPEPLPRQFRELLLGMSLDDLRSALTRDSLFRFRGDRDVSFLPVRQEALVETTGFSFIRRAHFQLSEREVFIMTFLLDTRFIDHYSVFTAFVNRYGQPISLSPLEAVWENEDTRVSIERPLTVKYIDKTVFDRLREESRTRTALETLRREEFLAEF
jgi:hypothetical protein